MFEWGKLLKIYTARLSCYRAQLTMRTVFERSTLKICHLPAIDFVHGLVMYTCVQRAGCWMIYDIVYLVDEFNKIINTKPKLEKALTALTPDMKFLTRHVNT